MGLDIEYIFLIFKIYPVYGGCIKRYITYEITDGWAGKFIRNPNGSVYIGTFMEVEGRARLKNKVFNGEK